jgi:opacity protein-like surface antigen
MAAFTKIIIFVPNHPVLMTKRFTKTLLLCLLAMPFWSSAQIAKKRWKAYRIEYSIALGGTSFLGELGGANRVGTHAFRDLEFSLTRPVIGVGYRYKLSPTFAINTKGAFGIVAGDDKLTQEPNRNKRNLSFKSNIYELSTNLEVAFLQEQVGHRYRLRGVRGLRNVEISAYGFLGVGVFHFNPKAKLGGDWYELQPLGTEGQGNVATRQKYKRTQICVPLGIGVKYAIDRQWSVGLEIGLRYTFTDYIDDVSKSYYYNRDGSSVNTATDPILGQLADRSLDDNEHAGQQRGDPRYNDAYVFTMFSLNYRLKTGRINYPMF